MVQASAVTTTIGSLGPDALSALVGLVVGAAVGVARWSVAAQRPARRAWRFKSGRDLVIVIATSGMVDTGTYQRAMTGLGQVRALSILTPSLRSAYRDVDLQRVRLSEELGEGQLDSDLLVIGGPKNSSVTKMLLDKLRPQLPFSVENTSIIWDGITYDGQTVSGQVVHDYGYVVRTTHPLHPARRVVIIGGSHTYGTACAARWLIEEGGSRRLRADIAVLIEADVVLKGHVSTPRAIHKVALAQELRER
jgi:hypothetical protein